MSLDLETRDDGLSRGIGPGWPYGAGAILGAAVAAPQYRAYLSHERFGNKLWEWIKALFDSGVEVAFHNASYDLGWLTTVGIKPPAIIHDTMGMAVMLDENRLSYSLDAVAGWQGVPGKDEQLLREAAAAFGISDVKTQMWALPEEYIGPYAEQDAVATLTLSNVMLPKLAEQDLIRAYTTEMDLIPLVVEMRRRGVRVDVAKAEASAEKIEAEVRTSLDELGTRVAFGRRLDIGDIQSPTSLERMFDDCGVHYPRTAKTRRGSFEGDWMRAHDHWLPKTIADIRFRSMVASKFLRTFICEFSSSGRIHPEIHTLRSDDGGTRSYRFSYSNPPLQQMSAGRIPGTEWVKEEVRGAFLPEKGEYWFSPDYSQQEPRLTVHYAVLTKVHGSEEAARYYRENENADYHSMVAEMANIPRKQAKIINLGLAYGMGVDLLAESLGLPKHAADILLKLYHDKVPFIRLLSDRCSSIARSSGYIRLIDNARCRFDRYELASYGAERGAYPLDVAAKRWPGKLLRRAFTHKAMNRLIQGSAARQTKIAMVQCWREGFVPLIQMHDELCFSVNSEKDGSRIATIMRECVPLVVPVRVDEEYGTNWGNANKTWKELHS